MSIWIRIFTKILTNGTQVDMIRSGLKVWRRLMPSWGGDQGIILVVSTLIQRSPNRTELIHSSSGHESMNDSLRPYCDYKLMNCSLRN